MDKFRYVLYFSAIYSLRDFPMEKSRQSRGLDLNISAKK